MEILLYALLLFTVCLFVACLIALDEYKKEVQYYRYLNQKTIEYHKQIKEDKNV
jgi:hypothetical protein